MSEERKQEPRDEAEVRFGFSADDGYKEVRGKDMSTTGPGAGSQRIVLEGDYSGIRERLLRGEVAPEQTFRSTALNYLRGAYPGMEARQHQTIIDQALEVPNYQNLFHKMLVAAIYFRQRTPLVRSRRDLSTSVLDDHAAIVLEPLYNDAESRSGKKKLTKEMYRTQLKADLLRYLRYLLPL